MNILHVVPSLAREWGGPLTVISRLAELLQQLNVQGSMVATKGYRVGTPQPLRAVNCHVARTSPLSHLWTAHSFEVRSMLRDLIGRADVVHIHELWHYPHWIAARLAHQQGVPYIISPHGELDPWRLNYKWWKKRPYLALTQRALIAKAAAVHAITEAEASETRLQVPDANVRIIPNGVNPYEFAQLPTRSHLLSQYPELDGKRIVLFIGRLQKVKGLDILVKAFAALARERSDLALVIAGPDEGFRSRMVEQLQRSRLSERAVFTGFVSGADKRALLGAAELFALPSHGEGFSAAVLEAMASGLPVVVTRQCKFPDIAEWGAGIIIEPDCDQLADAIRSVLDQPHRRRAMGNRARELVRAQYSWSSIVQQMYELYRDVQNA